MIVTRGTDCWVYTCPHIRRWRSFSVDMCNIVAAAALTSKQVVLMLVSLQARCFPVLECVLSEQMLKYIYIFFVFFHPIDNTILLDYPIGTQSSTSLMNFFKCSRLVIIFISLSAGMKPSSMVIEQDSSC